MLKHYVAHEVIKPSLPSATVSKPSVSVDGTVGPACEELMLAVTQTPEVRLNNSAIMANLDSHLSYLPICPSI